VRIVLLNQYYAPDTSATAQILSDLGRGLAAAGHTVEAVCGDRGYNDPTRRFGSSETIDGVQVWRTPTTGFGRGNALGRIADYVSFLFGAIWLLVVKSRPDVVISLSTPPLVAGLGHVLARLRRARSVYWVMDVYPDVAFELGVIRRGSLAGRLFALLSRAVLRNSDHVVALGETMARRVAANCGRPVHAIHNWADGEAIRPRGIERHPLREEWGWGDRFVVLYSGNMGLAHDFETVLGAAERLLERPEIVFAFVGGGPRAGEIQRDVARRGLTNVQMRPYVERELLGQSLTSADVHLVTLREGMPGLLVPSKIYGILAAGRPTLYVGPREGEIADIVEEGGCGERIDLGDSAGLARCVEAYADDAARTCEHGRRARGLFDRRFTQGHGFEAFRRVIDLATEEAA